MKYKFCHIRIIVTKCDATFATKGDFNSLNSPRGYATGPGKAREGETSRKFSRTFQDL